MPNRFDEIRTQRLLMRRWLPSDRAPFAAMNADPVVMRYFPAVMEAAASNAFVDQLEERFETQGFGLWVLQRLADDAFLGFTGLNPLRDEPTPGGGGMEVGWRLAGHAWGHGYATEAAREAVRVGLHPVDQGGAQLPELWSHTAMLNTPSQAVMRRLGMSEHARFDHPRLPVGHPLRPSVAYRVRPAC